MEWWGRKGGVWRCIWSGWDEDEDEDEESCVGPRRE